MGRSLPTLGLDGRSFKREENKGVLGTPTGQDGAFGFSSATNTWRPRPSVAEEPLDWGQVSWPPGLGTEGWAGPLKGP